MLIYYQYIFLLSCCYVILLDKNKSFYFFNITCFIFILSFLIKFFALRIEFSNSSYRSLFTNFTNSDFDSKKKSFVLLEKIFYSLMLSNFRYTLTNSALLKNVRFIAVDFTSPAFCSVKSKLCR